MHPEKTTARFEAFSDGIIAVAITILALEIGVKDYPGVTNANLWDAIGDRLPMYSAYFNSFATILLVWMGHHRIVGLLKSTNHWVQLANGLVLMLVALFPFPTRMVGEFLGTGGESTAVCFYAAYTGAIVASLILLNAVIRAHEPLLHRPAEAIDWLRRLSLQQWTGLAIYALAALLAWWSPIGALLLTTLVWAMWVFSTAD